MLALLRGPAVRATKLAIAAAFAADTRVSDLVPVSQIYAVERATLPTLPSIELVGVSSERIGDGPMVRHSMSIEITASDPTEDGADETLDSIVAAVRARLSDAADSTRPMSLASGAGVLVELQGSRWSVSAADASSVIRGASVSVTAAVGE